MEYFKEPVVEVFMQNVSKEVANFLLTKTIEKNKKKL